MFICEFYLKILKLSTQEYNCKKLSSFLPSNKYTKFKRISFSFSRAQTAIYTGDTKTIEKYCCWEILPKRNWRKALVLSPSVSMKLKFPATDRTLEHEAFMFSCNSFTVTLRGAVCPNTSALTQLPEDSFARYLAFRPQLLLRVEQCTQTIGARSLVKPRDTIRATRCARSVCGSAKTEITGLMEVGTRVVQARFRTGKEMRGESRRVSVCGSLREKGGPFLSPLKTKCTKPSVVAERDKSVGLRVFQFMFVLCHPRFNTMC